MSASMQARLRGPGQDAGNSGAVAAGGLGPSSNRPWGFWHEAETALTLNRGLGDARESGGWQLPLGALVLWGSVCLMDTGSPV